MSKGERTTKEKRFSGNIITIDPHGDIDRAIKGEDWVSGFSHAVTYIEHFGTIKIRDYIKSKILKKTKNEEEKNATNNQLEDDLKNLSAMSVVLLLFALEIVNCDVYLRLRKIIAERNRLQHPVRRGIGFRHSKEEKNRREHLLRQAKTLIEKISRIRL